MKTKFSNLIWGTFLLLAAVFILLNQFNGFVNIGIPSIIIAALSLIFLVQCIADLRFALLPVPLAVLYIIFQTPFGLPPIRHWTLILASVLASFGLTILFPRKYWHGKKENKHFNRPGNQAQMNTQHAQVRTEYGSNDNNPSVNVNFGAVSRHLCADSLETAQLHCNFGALEVFFDQVELSPKGAEATLNCSFGAIKLFIPKHWRVINRLNCTLGGVDAEKNFATPAENAPQLTLTGSVSLGGIEVRYI